MSKTPIDYSNQINLLLSDIDTIIKEDAEPMVPEKRLAKMRAAAFKIMHAVEVLKRSPVTVAKKVAKKVSA